MSKREKDMTKAAEAPRPEPTVVAEGAAEGEVEGADEVTAEGADEVAAVRREVEELRDKNLRLVAETQNLQKRALREKQEALRYAESEFARELLVVLDDLERTQESAKTATDVKSVADGVRIVYENFLKVLRQHEIEPIDALGKPFDPTYHEALMQQPSDKHPAGTVMQEMARGYTMHQRVIRPSRVVVSSGPADGLAENEKQAPADE